MRFLLNALTDMLHIKGLTMNVIVPRNRSSRNDKLPVVVVSSISVVSKKADMY